MAAKLVNPIVMLIARLTNPELARAVQYLKAENDVLRSKLPKKVQTTRQERERLLKLAEPLGNAIRDLISIVTYRTFLRWKSEKRLGRTPTRGPGRPRKPEDLRQLVVRMASENGWGYTRILAELKKMKVGPISRSTVRNILIEHGFDLGPKRGQGTWDEFVRIHIKTLWATDFFTKEVWTAFGKATYYVLFFIHIGTRRVHVAGMTPNPDGPWMANCARNMRLVFQDEGTPSYILRDGDPKFTAQFEAIIESEGAKLKRLPFRAPNLNPYAERWVELFKQECLDRFMVFGEKHLRHIVESYAAYYNAVRPNKAAGYQPIAAGGMARPESVEVRDGVACESWLGGILRHYRKAA